MGFDRIYGLVCITMIYDDNFERLMSLLPSLRSYGEKVLDVQGQSGLHISVLEHHKYTTVVRLAQQLPLSFLLVTQPTMTVRVYHDAQVAEVLSYQNHNRFNTKYDYPNPDMCQVREKLRVNEFLGEWLDYCLMTDVPVRTMAVS